MLNLNSWQIENFTKSDCLYSYRNSIFKKTEKYFIIKAKFDLSKKIEKYHSDEDNIFFRENKQPKWNTCWSFFKNPTLDKEKFLCEFPELCEDNVKNISAYFSDLHSNFLMSDWNWSYKDLIDLIELAQRTVKEKFWVLIEPEVRIIKN